MISTSPILLQVAVPAAVSISVVALAHVFTLSRDRRNRRQEQRIAYLIEAYRSFSAANHHSPLYEVADRLEQAVADVQLFGTPQQAALVRQFAIDLGNNQEADLDDILSALRDSLRSELGAEPVSSRVIWLKIGRKEQ